MVATRKPGSHGWQVFSVETYGAVCCKRILKQPLRYTLFLILASMLGVGSACAAQWTRAYGGGAYDTAQSIQPTADGGYVVTGYAGSDREGGVWVFKLDPEGNMMWQKHLGTSLGHLFAELGFSIQQTPDGGYVVAGVLEAGSFGVQNFRTGVVMKLDGSGNLVWQKTYGAMHSRFSSIRVTPDGGYMVAGSTDAVGAGASDGWLLKLDADGNIIWQRTYGTSDNEIFNSLEPTSDGGYIVGGQGAASGRPGMWLLKLDATGGVVWQKLYMNATQPALVGYAVPSPDGGYIQVGYLSSGTSASVRALAIKYDAGGNLVWKKAYGGTQEYLATAVLALADGSYIIVGRGTEAAWVMKIDAVGNIIWQRTYTGSLGGYPFNAVQQTADGDLIAVGSLGSLTPEPNWVDALIVKMDQNGHVSGCANEGDAHMIAADDAGTSSSTAVIPASSSTVPVASTLPFSDTTATAREFCLYNPGQIGVPVFSNLALTLMSAILALLGSALIWRMRPKPHRT